MFVLRFGVVPSEGRLNLIYFLALSDYFSAAAAAAAAAYFCLYDGDVVYWRFLSFTNSADIHETSQSLTLVLLFLLRHEGEFLGNDPVKFPRLL